MSPRNKSMEHVLPKRLNSLRLPGFDYTSNSTYFLTICTKDKIAIFTDRERRYLVLENAKLISVRLGMSLLVCGVMPDHIHIIIHNPGVKRITISECVRQFKSRLYQEFRQRHGLTESFWQRFYYDHILRNDLDLAEKLEYIVNNPVKAELTSREADPDYIYLNLPDGGAT